MRGERIDLVRRRRELDRNHSFLVVVMVVLVVWQWKAELIARSFPKDHRET